MRYCDYPTVDTDCLALTGLAKAGGGEARGAPSGAGGVPDCPLHPRIGLATDVVMHCGYWLLDDDRPCQGWRGEARQEPLGRRFGSHREAARFITLLRYAFAEREVEDPPSAESLDISSSLNTNRAFVVDAAAKSSRSNAVSSEDTATVMFC